MKSNTKNFIVLGIYQGKSVYYNNENHQLLYSTKDKTNGATALTGYSSIALILYSVLRSISKNGKVPTDFRILSLIFAYIIISIGSSLFLYYVLNRVIELEEFQIDLINYQNFLKQEKRNVLILYITIICFLLIGIVTAAIFISSGNYISLVLTLSSYFIVYTILNTKLIKRSVILRQLYKELENKDISLKD
ncbi:hypothetical protein [Streptococcus mitis]|uniref:Tandem five-TM protein n=1 Tax=Streptococcus mitis TaxID=28037 RepID=A0A7X1RGV4_STRMT|nr:hypothetical protein [Streptococcus mitis]MQQ31174.1 hypothetical protein [Streptococcus mitis]MQQ49982.1 hypothetical protein [Streptococcus mitis]